MSTIRPLTLRIDWSELDYFGHVNNVSFFKYIQSARVHYWDQIGLTESHRRTNIGPMLASCKCTFRSPLYYPGEVCIHTHARFIGNTSFGFEHRLMDGAGVVAAEAEDVMVMYDFNQGKKVPFPADMRTLIEQLEQKSFS